MYNYATLTSVATNQYHFRSQIHQAKYAARQRLPYLSLLQS